MVGSGVILVALHNNKVYYLFGKEGSMERDKKCHWGDFGGGAKPGEDLLDTTTREGAEELNGFFGSKVDFEKYILKNKIDEVAYDKRYTYLVKTEYDERLPFYFNNNYKFICEYLKGHVEHPTNGLFEKSEIRWFTVDDLKREKHIFRDYFRNIIDIVIYNHPKTLSKLKRGGGGVGGVGGNKTIRTTRVKFSTSDLMKCERIRKHKNHRKTHKRGKRGF
uniref:Nudix hydrolase domain-containing protein n=1 Tax=viral metagenome TaxID=1070528 RepID=A0A6C0EZM9_9ZZZZ